MTRPIEPDRSQRRPRLGIFGDSIANGLGTRKPAYSRILSEKLGLDVVDYSASARTIATSLQMMHESDDALDVAIIAHGSTEAVLRPSEATLRWMPRRWQRTGWMDPRPFYSNRALKHLRQRAESEVRWRLKTALLRADQARQIMDIETYVRLIQELSTLLSERGCKTLLVSPCAIDDRYFPGTHQQFQRYFESTATVADLSVTLDGELAEWEDFCLDHFHPNDQGHSRIAKALEQPIVSLLENQRGVT